MAKQIDAEAFISAWQRSSSIQEVAERIKIQASSAYVRAGRYRKLGIPLKQFNGAGRKPLDVKSLAALAKRLTKAA